MGLILDVGSARLKLCGRTSLIVKISSACFGLYLEFGVNFVPSTSRRGSWLLCGMMGGISGGLMPFVSKNKK